MSRSLRLSDALFDSATAAGKLLSRSAAQQVEHWSRLGKAMEDRGLTIETAVALLDPASGVDATRLWAHKRKLQKRDLALVESGQVKQADMYLFTAEMARKLKILNGPY